MSSDLDKIFTRNNKFRNRLLIIHLCTTLFLVGAQVIAAAFDLVPKWVLGITPMVIIGWGVVFLVKLEIHQARTKKEVDDYFDRTYPKFKNEKHIRSSLEE